MAPSRAQVPQSSHVQAPSHAETTNMASMLSSLETAMQIAEAFEGAYRDNRRWVCPRCLSTEVLPTRQSTWFVRLARSIGAEVCRCHQCRKRTVWF